MTTPSHAKFRCGALLVTMGDAARILCHLTMIHSVYISNAFQPAPMHSSLGL